MCRWKKRAQRRKAELAEARRQVERSRARATRELREATSRLAESQRVAHALRTHNDSNAYSDWLEEVLALAARRERGA